MSRRASAEAWNRLTNKGIDRAIDPIVDVEIMTLWAMDPTDSDWVGDNVQLATRAKVDLLLHTNIKSLSTRR